MYRYDAYDEALVRQRVVDFRGQVRRRFDGDLDEDRFRPFRLMNGLYQEMHSYMLRVAIPYGTLSSAQLRKLAHVARTYDRGWGHFTTRQNIQFNWVTLADAPRILSELADVDMHAIQSSGNCVRNVTADHFAGAAADEVEDARVWAEIIRQWSTQHPEFLFLPRKFKIAVTGSESDRAATCVHDIGLRLRRGDRGETAFDVLVGGGQGRIPMLAATVRRSLPGRHLLSYLEAILRVYNRFGRRDNKYKARIKILVHDLGADAFAALVESEWEQIRDSALMLPPEEVTRIRAHFAPPPFAASSGGSAAYAEARLSDPSFAAWASTNVAPHKAAGYGIVTIPLLPDDGAPGDATDAEMDVVADLADRFSFGEVRVSHEQNLVLPHVELGDLHGLWRALREHGLAAASAGLATDLVACPGMDFCSLATARSIPVARQIARRFHEAGRLREIGELKIRISGCVNACGHHHVGHIGILGIEKGGEEYYQITVGGSAGSDASLGTVVGPAFAADKVADAVETLVGTYLAHRAASERFIDTFRRIGIEPFRRDLYATD